MEVILAFFTSVINAAFDFQALGEFFGNLVAQFTGNADIAGIWDTVMGFIAPYATIVPIVVIALFAIVLFFGKKLLPVLRFLAFVIVGYGAGVIFVSPLINNIFALPSFVSGIVVAIVAGVLSKVLYYVLVVAGAAYVAYMVAFTGFVPQVASFTQGNMVVSLVVAVVAVVLVLLLLKYIEMAGTAFLGAFYISEWVIGNYFDYTAVIPFDAALVKLIAVAVVALIGFIVQVKTRTRY
jgi:hypothetical protein